jgi:zinc transport system permease protein
MSLLSYQFMQYALVAALLTGLAAPAVGTFLVQRRLSLLGDGIGHIAVTGVALGLLTGTSPTLTAVLVAIAGAVVIEVIRTYGRSGGDVALALIFYGGIAGGVLLTGLAGQGPNVLYAYLFGSITTVSGTDLLVTVVLAVAVLVVTLGLAPRLFAVAQDPEFARAAGLRVGFYNILVSAMAAVTVTVAMRTVGLLLVSALMVVPVATAQQLSRGFRATLAGAMVMGCIASVAGLLISAYVDVAPGATIVLLTLAGFGLTWPVGALIRRRRRMVSPFPSDVEAEAHQRAHAAQDHEHGPDCGHRAVPHGDHVDYLHDGHRHAPHGAHYDEH